MVSHVLTVMFVFSLMDRRRLAVSELDTYLDSVPRYADFNRRYLKLDREALADLIVGDLQRNGAVRRLDGLLFVALGWMKKKTGAWTAPGRKMRKNMARNCRGPDPGRPDPWSAQRLLPARVRDIVKNCKRRSPHSKEIARPSVTRYTGEQPQ